MRRRLGAALAAPAGWGAGGLDTLRSDFGLGGGLAIAGFAGLAVIVGALAGIAPALAIGLSVGLVFALLAFTNLGGAFVVFTFLAFLEFAVPSGAAVGISKGAGLVLAMAWLARVATTRGREGTFLTAHPGITYMLLAFLGWSVVSTTWSASAGDTLVAVSRYLLDFTLLVIAFTAIRRREYAIAFFVAFIAGTAFTAGYGLIHTPTTDSAEAARLDSSVGDANEFAAILVAGIVISIALAVTARDSPVLRFAAGTTAALALFSFVLTGSRSGVIALCVVVLTTILVAGKRWRPMAVVVGLALSIGAIVFFAAFAPASIRDRISQTVPGQVPEQEGRTTIWQVGWRMFEDNPVHGVGLGSFQKASINFVLEPGTLARTDQIIDSPKVAHNAYLETLAELGIVGLLLFLAILAFPLVCALLAARNFARVNDLQLEVLSRALVVALAGILAADFFVSAQLSKLLWLLLAMGPVLLAISRKALSSAPAAQAGVTPTPLAAHSRS
jgi:O-antigen ligase